MKFLFAFIVFVFVVITVIDGQSLGLSEDKTWELYKKKHSKNYNIAADGGKRDRTRKEIFLQRYKKIKEHNSDPFVQYRKELNRFSDLLPGELKKFFGLNQSAITSVKVKQTIKPGRSRPGNSKRDIPSQLDYRYDPCLPEVKNQGRCGSCWAFSAMTPLEFAFCKKNNGFSVPLSEQQLLDCDKGGFNYGCNGGWPVAAWEYILTNGVASGSQYPYKGDVGNCKYTFPMRTTGVSYYNYIEPENVEAMQVALVKYGPLSVALTVTQSFIEYASGVYNDNECEGKELNHAVVIVGWGVLNGIEYWIARNSWGTNWGKGGYVLIQKGVNKCGIEKYPAYVQVE